MPRKKRIWKLNKCHHVMLRGIAGKSIFEDQQDRVKFCLLLQEAAERHNQRVHAFCLMSNHIHLVIEPNQGIFKDGIHCFAFRYAQYFNKRHNLRGYLFQGRFKSILVEDGLYLKRLTRYIHLNPVDAGIVEKPEEYVWSSHNAYFGKTAFTWLEKDRILSRFGENRNDALKNLAEFTERKLEARSDTEQIRRAERVGVYGTDEFVRIYAPEHIEKVEDFKMLIKLSVEEIIQRVCIRLNLSPEQLRGSGKSKKEVDGRSVLIRTCQLVDGGSLGGICRTLGKHHGTVSRLASRAAQSPTLSLIVEELLV